MTMRVGEVSFRCPCCVECKDCNDFQKVAEIKDAGLVIFRHQINTNDVVNKPTEILEPAVSPTEDVFIFQNTKDVDIPSADVIPNLESLNISCRRCRNIYERAQKLLKRVPIIGEKLVMGICDHCYQKQLPKSCCICEKTVSKFLAAKYGERDTKGALRTWLSKMKDVLRDMTSDDMQTTKALGRAYSELYIDKMSQLDSRSPEKLEEKDNIISVPERRRSDINISGSLPYTSKYAMHENIIGRSRSLDKSVGFIGSMREQQQYGPAYVGDVLAAAGRKKGVLEASEQRSIFEEPDRSLKQMRASNIQTTLLYKLKQGKDENIGPQQTLRKSAGFLDPKIDQLTHRADQGHTGDAFRLGKAAHSGFRASEVRSIFDETDKTKDIELMRDSNISKPYLYESNHAKDEIIKGPLHQLDKSVEFKDSMKLRKKLRPDQRYIPEAVEAAKPELDAFEGEIRLLFNEVPDKTQAKKQIIMVPKEHYETSILDGNQGLRIDQQLIKPIIKKTQVPISTRMKKEPSTETIISTISQAAQDTLGKELSYFFPISDRNKLRKLKSTPSSATLIQDTHTKIEEDKLRKESAYVNKKQLDEIKAELITEEIRLAEERKAIGGGKNKKGKPAEERDDKIAQNIADVKKYDKANAIDNKETVGKDKISPSEKGHIKIYQDPSAIEKHKDRNLEQGDKGTGNKNVKLALGQLKKEKEENLQNEKAEKQSEKEVKETEKNKAIEEKERLKKEKEEQLQKKKYAKQSEKQLKETEKNKAKEEKERFKKEKEERLEKTKSEKQSEKELKETEKHKAKEEKERFKKEKEERLSKEKIVKQKEKQLKETEKLKVKKEKVKSKEELKLQKEDEKIMETSKYTDDTDSKSKYKIEKELNEMDEKEGIKEKELNLKGKLKDNLKSTEEASYLNQKYDQISDKKGVESKDDREKAPKSQDKDEKTKDDKELITKIENRLKQGADEHGIHSKRSSGIEKKSVEKSKDVTSSHNEKAEKDRELLTVKPSKTNAAPLLKEDFKKQSVQEQDDIDWKRIGKKEEELKEKSKDVKGSQNEKSYKGKDLPSVKSSKPNDAPLLKVDLKEQSERGKGKLSAFNKMPYDSEKEQVAESMKKKLLDADNKHVKDRAGKKVKEDDGNVATKPIGSEISKVKEIIGTQDDLILRLVRLKQATPTPRVIKNIFNIDPLSIKDHHKNIAGKNVKVNAQFNTDDGNVNKKQAIGSEITKVKEMIVSQDDQILRLVTLKQATPTPLVIKDVLNIDPMSINDYRKNIISKKIKEDTKLNTDDGNVEKKQSIGHEITKVKEIIVSHDDLILRLVRLKQATPTPRVIKNFRHIDPFLIKDHRKNISKAKRVNGLKTGLELEIDSIELEKIQTPKQEICDIIVGENIFESPSQNVQQKEEQAVVPSLFQSLFDVNNAPMPLTHRESIQNTSEEPTSARHPLTTSSKEPDPELTKGVMRYALSDRTFIDKGWTMLPTEKVVRKMNVYRMRPAQPQFDWFEHNKKKRLMLYDSGEKLAEFDDNGRGIWYYKNGHLALDYYDAEEVNANQRFVVYSSGEPDERGRSRPITVLATFDYLGNGVVFDHTGKIRLKYNQTEGVVLDRGIGPVTHWKWHTLNDPPVLQQVMIDTQMPHKDPTILKLGSSSDKMARKDNDEMLAIEFDNFIKEKSKKLSQNFKPFQIKMKALKINEHFSLRVLDQATVYLIYRDGTTNLKLNIGMVLDHKEIVDTDTADVSDVSNSLERFPARTESLAGLQRSVAYTQRYERTRTERERRLRPLVECASVDRITAAAARPLRPPLRAAPTGSTFKSSTSSSRCNNRNASSCQIYYNARLT